jgi:putative exporter of polyketide antibiotics
LLRAILGLPPVRILSPVAPVAERQKEGQVVMSSVSVPVGALVVIGIVLAVLGLLAPAIELLYVGIGAIVVAGVLGVVAQRRA